MIYFLTALVILISVIAIVMFIKFRLEEKKIENIKKQTTDEMTVKLNTEIKKSINTISGIQNEIKSSQESRANIPDGDNPCALFDALNGRR